MSATTDIQHFLVIYEIAAGEAHVEGFGGDYDHAIDAYEGAEQEYRGRDDIEVVLLSADSIETIKKTHSSYFRTHEHDFDKLVADLVAGT